MNQITQQNAAGSEESASASEELTRQADELRSLVACFQLSTVQNGESGVQRDAGDRRKAA
jgi:hypothetical protein